MSEPVDSIPTEELAVERDVTRDYLIRVRHAHEYAQNTYAELDGFADGDLSDAPTRHLREAQEHLSEAIDLLASEERVVESRYEAIQDRIAEEHDD